VWQRESDGLFFFVEDAGDGKMTLIDVDSGARPGLPTDAISTTSSPTAAFAA
jgi:hypothetical protein